MRKAAGAAFDVKTRDLTLNQNARLDPKSLRSKRSNFDVLLVLLRFTPNPDSVVVGTRAERRFRFRSSRFIFFIAYLLGAFRPFLINEAQLLRMPGCLL